MEQKLVAIGAIRIGEFFFKRRIFDYPDMRLDKDHSWLRLRDESDKVTLSFKRRFGVKSSDGLTSDDGMQEFEITVSDYKTAGDIILQLGLVEKNARENKRTKYRKGNVEFDLENCPRLNPYMEIEGKSWADVDQAILELGLDKNEAKRFSTKQIYALAGINESDYRYMGFDTFIKKDGTEESA